MRNSIRQNLAVADYHSGRRSVARMLAPSQSARDSQSSCVRFYYISELTMQRILIVEDEQNRSLPAAGLVEEGHHQADPFNNGRDGLWAKCRRDSMI